MAVAICAEHLGKRYRIGPSEPYGRLTESLTRGLRTLVGVAPKVERKDFWALREFSVTVEEGEILGVVGANGAGKSTVLKILSRVTEPTEGFAEMHGRVGCLLEVGTGFHQELTGRENVFLNGAILGMRRAEIKAKFEEIVDFAEVGEFIDTPVKRYSSGMQVRLAFAVAAHLDPEILIIDEVLAVGDLAFQAKCLGRMNAVARAGRTIVFVSHDLDAVMSLCTRCILLEGGRVVDSGAPPEVIANYRVRAHNAAKPTVVAI